GGGHDRTKGAVDVHLGRAAPPVRTGGVEERGARTAHPTGTERDPPHARHGDGKLPSERPAATAARIDVDPSAAEVRDEQIAAEPAESLRRARDTPRFVELGPVPAACGEPAGG